MSPHAVNNFVSDLVLMAQAMEKLPQVEQEVRTLRAENDLHLDHINQLNADLEQSRSYAATLEQKVRDAEVAKDSAETMFLEADERTSRALDFIKASFGSAGALIQSLEPPKPEPEVKAESASPLASSLFEANPSPAPFGTDGPAHNVTHGSEVQGQSEPGPTAAHSTESLSTSAHSTAESMPSVDTEGTEYHHAEPSWATPSPQPDTPPQLKPYADVNYIDVRGWISREDWLANGGTNESYDFRY